MKKGVEVVMLPTDNKTNIAIIGKNLIYSDCAFSNHEGLLCQYANLYGVTNEEINEGDNIIEKTGLGYMQPTIATKENMAVKEHIIRCKKIIVTNNKDLKIKTASWMGVDGVSKNMYKPLPEFPQEFIEEYCDEGGIDNILLEYNDNPPNGYTTENFLKLNSDNTVIVHRIEEKRYSLEEIMNALHQVELRDGKNYTKIWEGIKENI